MKPNKQKNTKKHAVYITNKTTIIARYKAENEANFEILGLYQIAANL